MKCTAEVARLFDRKGFYKPLKDMFNEMTKAGFLYEECMQHVIFSDRTEEIGRFIEKYYVQLQK